LFVIVGANPHMYYKYSCRSSTITFANFIKSTEVFKNFLVIFFCTEITTLVRKILSTVYSNKGFGFSHNYLLALLIIPSYLFIFMTMSLVVFLAFRQQN